MKSKINLIPRSDRLSGVNVRNGRAQWLERTMRVEGPAPAEIAHFEGFLPCKAWDTAIAGLAAPSLEVDWKGVPDTDWIALCSNPKALSAALVEVSGIVEYDGLRNYGNVIALDMGTVVATDGFRLAYLEVTDLSADFQLTIGKRDALLLAKLLLIPGAVLQVSQDLTTLYLRTTNTVESQVWKAYVRTSAVKFPAWRGILPKKASATLDADEVKRTVAQAKLLAKVKDERAKSIALSFVNAEGFKASIIVNPKFWAEANASALSWHFDPKDVDAPLLGTDGTLTYVVVPIHVPKEEKKK